MFGKLYKSLMSAGGLLQQHWVRNPQAILKKDGSPITPADIEVNEFLCQYLEQEFSLPVVSEESIPDWEIRKNYSTYWLLDPLDGTKEFLCRFGDFCICLALIKEHKVVLGMIYAPALNLVYYAGENTGAICYDSGKREELNRRKPKKAIAMVSRFHSDTKVDEFCQANSIEEKCIVGGALKYCYLAAGKGSVYIRYNRMKEWDVAAGNIILREAGGDLVALDTQERPSYNNEDLSIPPFIATAYDVDANSFAV